MDYKFRGRDKNGVWHYGFLNYSPIQTAYFIHVVEHTPPTMQDPCGDVYSHSFEVDPETVGQLFFKKDNEEFYADDFIECYNHDSDEHYGGIIVFDELILSCEVEDKEGTRHPLYVPHVQRKTGNIYENPELLNND